MNFRSFYKIFFFKEARELSAWTKMCFWIALCGGMAFYRTANAQAEIENIEQLRQKVANFLIAEYQQSNATKVDVKVNNLDYRLRLARCEKALALSLQDPLGAGGNVSVQVACNGDSHWIILVPATATVFRPVAIAGRNLQKGDVINPADLTTEPRDMSLYRQGFATQAADIIGKEVRFAVTKGEVLRTSALTSPLVIKSGDEVTIESSGGLVQVITQGIAVSDGRLGQQIRVKNSQSERIVNARVIGTGKVKSIL